MGFNKLFANSSFFSPFETRYLEFMLPKKRTMRLTAGISALLFSAVILLTDSSMAIPCLLAAAFHECGHLLFARLLHIPLSELKLDLFGARIEVSSGLISYKEEFFLAAAGPLFSFLLSQVLTFPFLNLLSVPFFEMLRDASLFLGILNLLPVRGFDGARMLSAFLSVLIAPHAAEFIGRFFTGLFLLLLWGISVYLLLITGGGLTLFVFSAGMFFKVFLS